MKRNHYYQNKINKAVDFINKNLADEINIKKLADHASFSPFHFQRIYKALQNETPYETLLRLRLEKAVFLIKHHPQKKISDIAFECGFQSGENFSRQFKSRFKFSPSTFRKDKSLQNSRIYQEDNETDFYNCVEESRTGSQSGFQVVLEDLPKIKMAFIRAIFDTDGSLLVQRYQELMSWAEKHKVEIKGELTRFGMSIDNPEVTPANKYRYDFAVTLHTNEQTEGLIEIGEIPKATYATLHVVGKLGEVARAWDYLYKTWLPNSAYVPLHYPALEEFIKGPEEIGWENFNLKCRIPVKKRTND